MRAARPRIERLVMKMQRVMAMMKVVREMMISPAARRTQEVDVAAMAVVASELIAMRYRC